VHERVVRLPVPSLDTKAFLKLLQLDLEAHPPEAPVIRLWMGVNPVKPRAAQTGLFVPVTPEPVKLELTLARIQGVVGEGRVGTPELLDTHRPDAFRMHAWGRGPGAAVQATVAARLVLRLFRPRRAARVAVASSRPAFVAAEGIRGKVTELAGPWRTSGDWWSTDPWQRDEWDIALSDGAMYRIYCEPGGWFVEGSYD
jgi:protein ImuB